MACGGREQALVAGARHVYVHVTCVCICGVLYTSSYLEMRCEDLELWTYD